MNEYIVTLRVIVDADDSDDAWDEADRIVDKLYKTHAYNFEVDDVEPAASKYSWDFKD